MRSRDLNLQTTFTIVSMSDRGSQELGIMRLSKTKKAEIEAVSPPNREIAPCVHSQELGDWSLTGQMRLQCTSNSDYKTCHSLY